MAGAPWWNEDHEKNFYEAIIVVMLVLLAMIFEDVFHALSHSAEHSYAYGASRDTHQNTEDRAHQHKQPFKELAQHLGTEFMTLGFLACVIFLGNISGFFEFLADLAQNAYSDSSDAYPGDSSYGSSNSSYGGTDSSYADDDGHRRLAAGADTGKLIGPWSMAMPRNAGDFLHLTEEVHIRMFFGMVIYFGIVFSIIQAGVARIREWAELTNRKILMEVHKLHDAHDSALTQYIEMSKYTIFYMLNWQSVNPERWETLVNTLYEDIDFVPGDDTELRDEVRTKLNESFSLGHYLASTLEDGVVDIIELHRVTWATLMFVFVFCMLMHQQKVKMVYIAGVILLVGVLGMGITYRQIRNQDRSIEDLAHIVFCKEKTRELGQGGSPTNAGEIPGSASKREIIAARMKVSQFVFLRVYETTLFVWCYSFASLVFNKEGWETEFLVSLVEVLLYTIFTFVAGSFLPTVVTHLFIQYSLPPGLDEHHFKILIRTIGDDDPALHDLARTGADEIKEAVVRANVRHHTSKSYGTYGTERTGARSRGNTTVSSGDGDVCIRAISSREPSAPVVASTLVATPPDLTGIPPTPGSLADAVSAVLATQEGLELVQKMVEEAARVRVEGIERVAASGQAAASGVDRGEPSLCVAFADASSSV